MSTTPGFFLVGFFLRRSIASVAAMVLLLLILIAGCQVNEGPSSPESFDNKSLDDLNNASFSSAVIVVNDEIPISKQELKDAFEKLYGKPQAGDTREDASDRVIDAVLKDNFIYIEAQRLGVELPENLRARLEAIKPLFIGNAYRTTLARSLKMDESIVDAMIPEDSQVITFSQIVHSDLSFAQLLRVRAAAGEDFAELARQYSTGPAAQNGGAIKSPLVTHSPSPYDEKIAERFALLDVGEISTVLKTGLGYTIFRIEEKRGLFPDERKNYRDNLIVNLEYSAGRQLVENIIAKFPLVQPDGAIESALASGDPEIVVGTVGDDNITWGWLQDAVKYLWKEGEEIAKEQDPNVWREYLKELSFSWSLKEESELHGFSESDLIQENMARAQKDATIEAYQKVIQERTEPGKVDVYQTYLGGLKEISGGQALEEAIFSVEGVRGLDGMEAALSVYEHLSAGEDIASILSNGSVGRDLQPEQGTYREADFDSGTVRALESTRIGEVTEPIPEPGDSDRWAVYRLFAKSRGEMAPFDSQEKNIRDQLWAQRYNDKITEILRRGMNQSRYEFQFGEGETRELVARWLDLQKALKGISPEGGYHGESMGTVPKEGATAPHGAPSPRGAPSPH